MEKVNTKKEKKLKSAKTTKAKIITCRKCGKEYEDSGHVFQKCWNCNGF